jgi:eukaryotic-like serine/threonine-protein kinase
MNEGLPETLNTPATRVMPSEGDASPFAHLLADQQARWQKGERVQVEEYLEQQPALRNDAEAVVKLIKNEMNLREADGETLSTAEYLQRFPQFAAQLAARFNTPCGLSEGNLASTLLADSQSPTQMAESPAPRAVVPEAVPGYEIRAVLGRGGMGVVYKAWHKALKRMVALKMILSGPHAASEDLMRFRIEAEAAARLQHPNITQIHDIGQAAGRPYMAMELVEGCSLADVLDGTPQPPRAAATLVETLALAIQHAHERGIVHRDLKPANILLATATEQERQAKLLGQPKITDFGLAKRLDTDLRQTQTGAVMGTPSYMSPEQASGRVGEISPATDVYALGAILYDMLTGRPPFKSNTLADTLQLVQASEPVSPTRLEPNVPRDLETICLKCLRKEPAKRYTTAQALADDLRRFLNGEPIEARPTPLPERVWKWARRRPAVAALIGVSCAAAIALLAGGVWSYAQISASLKEEERQRQMADKSLRQALNAVDKMLTQVGAVDLADVPQMEPVRKKLLGEAEGFIRQFLSERANDPSVRQEAGRIYGFQGDVQDMLGDLPAAEQAYLQAISVQKQLVAESPGELAPERELARNYSNLGMVLKKANRFQDAEAAMREGLALRERVAESLPDSVETQRDVAASRYFLGTVLAVLPGKHAEAEKIYRQALKVQDELAARSPEDRRAQARTLTNLGNLLKATDLAAAEQAYRHADDIQQQLIDRYPAVPSYRRELARTHNNLAVVLFLNGQPQQSEEFFARALKLVAELTSHFPEVPEYEKEAAIIHRDRGKLLTAKEKFAEAEKELDTALSILKKLVGAFPAVPDYRRFQAMAHLDLAMLQKKMKRPEDARKSYDRALEIQEKLVAEFPRVVDYRGDLGSALLGLGRLLYDQGTVKSQKEASQHMKKAIAEHRLAWEANRQNFEFRNALTADYTVLLAALLRLGWHADAGAVAVELPQVFPDDAPEYLRAAQCLALCAGQARADKQLDNARRQELADAYGRKAVVLIEGAIRQGFKNAQDLKNNPNYNSLRQRDDFKQVLHDLERGAVEVS